MMDFKFHIDPEHFSYLRIQKGSLDKYAGNRQEWDTAYHLDMVETYESIARYLPHVCGRFLDVGSGLGGIDVLIRRHYADRGQDPEVHLLDGMDDPPRVELHRRTFNHMRYARNFQVKNGCYPTKLVTHGPMTDGFSAPFDLVVSFGAWCFHFPPSWYLPALERGGLHAGTIAILDVRAGKDDYLEQLQSVFEIVAHAVTRPKWTRVVMRVRAGVL